MAGRPGRSGTSRACGALAAACAALLLAGCGGSPAPLSKSAYDAKMAAIGKQLSADLDPLAAATSAQAAAVALTKVQAELRSAQAELSAITPPTPIKSEHAKLTADVGRFVSELTPLIAALEKNDERAAAQVYTQPGLLAIQNDALAIQQAGYRVG